MARRVKLHGSPPGRRKAGRGPIVRVARRRPRGSDWQIGRIDVSGAPFGPDVVMPPLERLLAAFEGAPRGDDWPAVKPLVIPVFPRVRPLPAGYPAPLRTLVPPGVLVGFGVDIGPAFMAISPAQLDMLGISESELVAQSFANLIERAEQVHPASVVEHAVMDMPVAALQTGLFIASTLVLVPDQLRRIFGPAPRVFVAPMRDLIFGLPIDADPELASLLFDEFASQDPNCLALVAYRFDGERVVTATLGGPSAVSRRMLA